MIAQQIWQILSVFLLPLSIAQWVEGRRAEKLKERLAGLERTRWDRLAPARYRPKIEISPEARASASELLALAIDSTPATLAVRCRRAAGEEFLEAIEACRLVAGYLAISRCQPWPASEERLRRLAGEIQDALLEDVLLSAEKITRRQITDYLDDALRGPHQRNADDRLPGSVFPPDDKAMMALLVTGQLLKSSRPEACTWQDHLNRTCDTLNDAGFRPLALIPALIQHVQA
jgi:hypothetical protein